MLPPDPDAPAQPGSGIFGLTTDEAQARVVLVPVPFEATTSYRRGTANAPRAILEASHQVDLYDLETGRPYEDGIFMQPIDPEIERLNAQAVVDADRARDDADDTARLRVNEACDEVAQRVHHAVAAIIGRDKIAGVVGGEHSVSLGAIRAHAAHHGEIGVLQVDAHADLRDAYEGFTGSHASVMHRVLAEIPEVTRLVQVGVRDLGESELERIIESRGRVHTVFDPLLARARFEGFFLEALERAIALLPQRVYVSIDIDGLDPRYCPGTGTPVPGGLDFAEVSLMLERIAAAQKTIVGFDLTEVAPSPGTDWDANVGARMLYKLIGWTLQTRAQSWRNVQQLWMPNE